MVPTFLLIIVGDCDSIEGRENRNNDPVNLLVFGISDMYTSSITPAILKADDLILYPLMLLIWNSFPKPI